MIATEATAIQIGMMGAAHKISERALLVLEVLCLIVANLILEGIQASISAEGGRWALALERGAC